MKGLLRSLIVCLVAIGSVYLYTAYEDHSKELQQLKWPSVQGRFVTEADSLPAKVDGHIQPIRIDAPTTGFFQGALTFPFERFVYSVNGKTYAAEKTGLPSISSIRNYTLEKQIEEKNRQPVYDAEVVNALYARSNPSTGEEQKPTLDEAITFFAPNVEVFYDPSNPQIAMVDPYVSSFVGTTLYTGLALCLAGAVIFLCISYHDWMLKDTMFEDRVPDYFYDVTSQYYGYRRPRPEILEEYAPSAATATPVAPPAASEPATEQSPAASAKSPAPSTAEPAEKAK